MLAPENVNDLRAYFFRPLYNPIRPMNAMTS